MPRTSGRPCQAAKRKGGGVVLLNTRSQCSFPALRWGFVSLRRLPAHRSHEVGKTLGETGDEFGAGRAENFRKPSKRRTSGRPRSQAIVRRPLASGTGADSDQHQPDIARFGAPYLTRPARQFPHSGVRATRRSFSNVTINGSKRSRALLPQSGSQTMA